MTGYGKKDDQNRMATIVQSRFPREPTSLVVASLIVAAIGTGASVASTVDSYTQGSDNLSNVLRELAEEKARQLDIHHTENLDQQRRLAEKQIEFLSEKMKNLKDALEYIGDTKQRITVRFLSDVLKQTIYSFDDTDLKEKENEAMCRLAFEFDDSPMEHLSFQDVSFVTSWWTNKNDIDDIESNKDISKKLENISDAMFITQILEYYWICKFYMLAILV